MSCWGCESFTRGDRHSYCAGCIECAARSIAQSPAFDQARKAKRITPDYRAILDRIFLGDIDGGHKLVKGWAERLESHRAD
jgi:hypothetical protein